MKQVLTALLIVAFTYSNSPLQAQDKASQTKDLTDLSLEELMNIKIVSASKQSENVYDAPFSASVLTKDEIKKAGCTSLMEAFRLIPALLVKEQTNGNFDIHIRGLNNVPSNTLLSASSNTTTLVMIDGRPVYNYLQGGTFWESLPVDLNDIDRIEVVRGPAASMYGPNAVSGVINIITRRTEKDGLYALSNVQYGTNNTAIANASVGYRFNPKLSMIVSGNYQKRNRASAEYYLYNEDRYTTELPFDPYNQVRQVPHPMLAMNKYGTNAFINYAPSDNVSLDLSAGVQESTVQNAYLDNFVTLLSTAESRTHYADLKVKAGNINSQISYLGGMQDPSVTTRGAKYDFNTVDGYIEYAIKLKGITLKPGYNFRSAVYDDTRYWNPAQQLGPISARRDIITHAASLRSEYTLLNEKLRLFGSMRLDKFNYPEKVYFSYQLASNYKLNESNTLRLVLSKANRAPFIYDTYYNKQIDLPDFTLDIQGDRNLKMVTSQMVELGYRAKLSHNVHLDLDVFATNTRDYSKFITETSYTDPEMTQMKQLIKAVNIPLVVNQLGTTLSMNVVLNSLQVKPFITVQHTQLMHDSHYDVTPASAPMNTDPDPANNNYLTGKNHTHRGTPPVYGGAFINYQLSSKFNFSLNPYYYASHNYIALPYEPGLNNTTGIQTINPKLIMNARIAYKPVKQIDLFVSGKNMLGSNTREFYGTDRIGMGFLAGINYQF